MKLVPISHRARSTEAAAAALRKQRGDPTTMMSNVIILGHALFIWTTQKSLFVTNWKWLFNVFVYLEVNLSSHGVVDIYDLKGGAHQMKLPGRKISATTGFFFPHAKIELFSRIWDPLWKAMSNTIWRTVSDHLPDRISRPMWHHSSKSMHHGVPNGIPDRL